MPPSHFPLVEAIAYMIDDNLHTQGRFVFLNLDHFTGCLRLLALLRFFRPLPEPVRKGGNGTLCDLAFLHIPDYRLLCPGICHRFSVDIYRQSANRGRPVIRSIQHRNHAVAQLHNNLLRPELLAVAVIVTACSVSYKFNGASIDYTKIKTIQIADFPIRSAYVWGPMGPQFNNELKDQFTGHTRLALVRRNGDLKLEGEIIRYEQRNKSVSSEGYSAQTELSMTVNVRFTNNVNHNDDFEQQFTASQSYDSSLSLNSVQDELVTKMIKDICDQIFNACVANW